MDRKEVGCDGRD